jgi:1-acyl-sn-glycerol-3-phosphate acyltransferase
MEREENFMCRKSDEAKRKFSRTLKVERKVFLKFYHRTVRNLIVLNEENVKDMPTERMFVCCTHRSHLDYVILGMKIPDFGAQQIRFAAGDNLTRIPKLGKLFRSVGAFSVHRAKSSHKSYILRLANQVKMMSAGGDTIIVFPEAGRSYSGEMLDIKSGILSAGILAQKDERDNPIFYLPTAINYTKLPDLRAFDLLLKGKKLRDSSKNFLVKFLGSFIYYFADIWVFLTSYIFKIKTDVVLSVGKPVALPQITDVEKNYVADAKSPLAANRESINECTKWVADQLRCLFPILPMNVAAYLFDNFGEAGLNEKKVEETVEKLKSLHLNVDLLKGSGAKEILQDGIKALKENDALKGYSNVFLKKKGRLKYLAAFVNSSIKLSMEKGG